jgi:ABC-type uncharacterized transport system permease subunit
MSVPTAQADTITPEFPGLDDPPVPAPPDEVAGPSWFFRSGNSVVRFLMALLVAAAVFSIFMLVKGVNPVSAYSDMIHSLFRSPRQIGEIFIRATPIMLAGLAVAIPARAGLINAGGEGQLIVGGVAAAGVALAMGSGKPGWLVLLLMILGGAAAGAAWAAIAAVLRLWVDINEAVSTLLLNYVAIDLLGFLIYSPWKDSKGSGQPTTPLLASAARLPVIGDSRVHVGIVIAVVLALVCWFVLKKTSWGFRLRVTGGNQEAARRAGMSVGLLLLTAMLVGGALAGLGGFAQYAGTEFKLRPGFCATYGYLGFLASWLAGHRPIAVAGSAILLSAIAIGGDSLQIDSGLPAASVNILIALVLLAMFGLGRRKAVSA